MSLILEGFMGSGKSAVGRKLSARLGLDFIDTDAEIESRQGCAIAEIFADCGEEAFRQMETSMLQGLLLSESNAIISLGGGTPMRASNREIIKKLGRVVYLKAPEEVLISRLEHGAEKRPLLAGHELKERVRELLKDREETYINLADSVIDVSGDDMDKTCDMIMEVLKE